MVHFQWSIAEGLANVHVNFSESSVSNERQQRTAGAEQMGKAGERADEGQRILISVAILGVVVILIAVGSFAISKASKNNDDLKVLVYPAHTDRSTFGFDYTATDAGGTERANPVVVTLTEDFQCPVCRNFEQGSGAFLEGLVEHGDITINYRPISFLDRSSTNGYSSRAANAAMCVLDAGGAGVYKNSTICSTLTSRMSSRQAQATRN